MARRSGARRRRRAAPTRNPMARKLRAVLAVMLAAVAVGFLGWAGRRASGPRPGAVGPELTVVCDGWRLVRERPAPERSAVWDGQTIALTAARNEVVAWQVALWPRQPLVGLEVACEPLTGPGGATLPAERIEVFSQHYLEVTVPSQIDRTTPVKGRLGTGWMPCQLLPLRPGRTVDAPAGGTTGIWFDLHLPADQPPGDYTGKLTLTATGDYRRELPLRITVVDLLMPAETHFRNYLYYGPEQLGEFYGGTDASDWIPMERAYLRLAHDHRATMATEPMVGDGSFDWASWWSHYGPYLDGRAFESGPSAGVGASLWPMSINRQADDESIRAAARSIVDFCTAQGILDKVFLGVWDEPNDAAAYAEIRRIGRLIDEAVGDQLPTMVTEQVEPTEEAWGSLESDVDIFCSPASSPSGMDRVRRNGGEIWVYNGGFAGHALVDLPLTAVLAYGPAAWRFEVTGWYLWDCLYWRQKHYGAKELTNLYADPLTFDETIRKREDGTPYPPDWALRLNGDGVLLYPGEPMQIAGPVASLRLKAFRRGAQDYNFLWLLRQAGQGELADTLARRLSLGRGEWEANPDTYVKVRDEMRAALLAQPERNQSGERRDQ